MPRACGSSQGASATWHVDGQGDDPLMGHANPDMAAEVSRAALPALQELPSRPARALCVGESAELEAFTTQDREEPGTVSVPRVFDREAVVVERAHVHNLRSDAAGTCPNSGARSVSVSSWRNGADGGR